jgi:hypothetical protein
MLNGAGACCNPSTHLYTATTVKTPFNWLALLNQVGKLLALGYAVHTK